MPLLFCLHGAGSNKQIFETQTAKLRACLGKSYEFFFVNAPIASNAGPGMLPMFAGAGPYYSWFSVSGRKREEEITDIQDLVRTAVDAIEGGRIPSVKARQVDGIIAFSQGAIVGTMLLLQQHAGMIPWFPQLKFAIFICADYSDALMHCTKPPTAERDSNDAPQIPCLSLPSVHLHGTVDPHGRKSRKLMDNHFEPSSCKVMWFNGSHQCPTAQGDCQKALALISLLENLPHASNDNEVTTLNSHPDSDKNEIPH
jgi:hypothetical protein